MKSIKFHIIFCVGILLFGCSSSNMKTRWKADHLSQISYNNILVVGVIKNEDTSFRKKIEYQFVTDLEALGYHAGSALAQFGYKGLADLGEENTYLKLCNRGIDAVITVALIDKERDQNKRSYGLPDFPSKYYYDRIWNYKNMQAEVNDKYSDKTSYFWEIILFDLLTLQPQYVIQTKPFNPAKENINTGFLNQGIRKMIKEKIIRKQNGVTKKLKPF